MKIAFLTDSVSRRAGGLFDANRRLAQELCGLGEQVRVIGVEDAQSAEDVAAWSPVEVRVARCQGLRRLGYAPELGRHLEQFDPDVVHTHGLWTYTSLVSSRWHQRTGRPVIIHPHGMLDPWAVRNSAWKKRLAGWLFEYRHLQNAACIRALCQSEADAIRAFGLKNPIAIIPNGMDLPEVNAMTETRGQAPASGFGPLASSLSDPSSGLWPPIAVSPFSGPCTLLYLGRIHPKKGLVNLLRAWAVVCGGDARRQRAADSGQMSENPSSGFWPPSSVWRLVIAGWDEGGHESELKRLCDELGIAWNDARGQRAEDGRQTPASGLSSPASVCFLGPQFGEAKAACYHNCDAFILPSFSEGLPMVVLEAWAYGKPVLMTPECNLPEGFAANAALRIEPNVESIAAGLRDLFQAPGSELLACGQKGRELVRTRFTWPKIASDLRAVYTWLLGQGTKPDCVRE